jgi:tripartite motif-containing protein 37
VNCRFVSEITAEIDKLTVQHQAKKKEDDKKKQPVSEDCTTHCLPMSYYCETCKEPLCSDCAMFGDKHKYHKFKKISEVYQKHIDVVKKETHSLKKRLKQLDEILVQIDDNIYQVNKAKTERIKEVDKVVHDMKEKLETQLNSKKYSLTAQRKSISEEIALLQRMYTELQKQIESSPQSILIAKTPDIRKMIQEVHKKPADQFAKIHVSPDFVSEIVPEYDVGEFTIEGYNDLRQSTDVIYSQPINVNGLSWRLKVYPNGTGMARGTFLSVFLEMWKGLKEAARYEYKVEMVNHNDPEKSVIREFSSVFEIGECWGYNRFYKVELLKNEGFVLSDSDTVKFKFYVRAPNYYDKCKELQRYVKNVRDQRNGALRQVEDLKKKLVQYTGTTSSTHFTTVAVATTDVENKDVIENKEVGEVDLPSNNNDLTEPVAPSTIEQDVQNDLRELEEVQTIIQNAIHNWDSALQSVQQSVDNNEEISDIHTSAFINIYSAFPPESNDDQSPHTPVLIAANIEEIDDVVIQRDAFAMEPLPKIESIMCSPIEPASDLDQSNDEYADLWLEKFNKDRVDRSVSPTTDDEEMVEENHDILFVEQPRDESDFQHLSQNDIDTVIISSNDLNSNL